MLYYAFLLRTVSCSTLIHLAEKIISIFVCLLLAGEGFHNYHHTFPYDYATSEFGYKLNITAAFIDLMCFLGLASDRKKVSKELIQSRVKRTGDGSHKSGWAMRKPRTKRRRPVKPRKNVATRNGNGSSKAVVARWRSSWLISSPFLSWVENLFLD